MQAMYERVSFQAADQNRKLIYFYHLSPIQSSSSGQRRRQWQGGRKWRCRKACAFELNESLPLKRLSSESAPSFWPLSLART